MNQSAWWTTWRGRGRCLGLIAVFYVASVPASAEEASRPTSRQIWVNPGFYSWHFDRQKDLRANNAGIGVEIGLSNEHRFLAGTFINSNSSRSHYGAYVWSPISRSFGGSTVFAGIALGAFDGYAKYRNGEWFLAPLPVFGIEGSRVGMNVSVIPTIKNRLDGALAIQLKFRI
jgi:hypothetical protein